MSGPQPGWRFEAPGRRWIFYDGHCAFCHRSVRLVLRHEQEPRFLFSPRESPAYQAVVPQRVRAELPPSVVVVDEGGGVYVRSDASLFLLDSLGNGWQKWARLARWVPRWLREAMYKLVAVVRYRLAGRTQEVCPMLPDHLKQRFVWEADEVAA